MRCVPTTPSTILLHLQTISSLTFVFSCAVIPTLAVSARERDNVSH